MSIYALHDIAVTLRWQNQDANNGRDPRDERPRWLNEETRRQAGFLFAV